MVSSVMLGLAALSAGSVVAAAQQRLPGPPVKTRSRFVMGDGTASMSLGRLEKGRRYRLRFGLEGTNRPEASAELVVEGIGQRTVVGLDYDSDSAAVELVPGSSGSTQLRIRGGGEIDSLCRVRVEWQAEPAARMAAVEYVSSPNQNERRAWGDVTAVVVHATVSPTTEGTVTWFLTPQSQVSAHYVVGKDGRIVQMVDDTARAWHAGVSELRGVRGVNDYSIGIEIVNLNDGKDPYTDAQYEAVAAIVRHIREQYNVPDSRIVSHEMIARPPGRKSDPKGFDFARLLRMSAVEPLTEEPVKRR